MVSNIWNTDRTSLDWTIPTHEVAGLKFKYDQFNNLIKNKNFMNSLILNVSNIHELIKKKKI